jgi:hypothetical protein
MSLKGSLIAYEAKTTGLEVDQIYPDGAPPSYSRALKVKRH